jgi:hypothetical protein
MKSHQIKTGSGMKQGNPYFRMLQSNGKLSLYFRFLHSMRKGHEKTAVPQGTAV